MVKAFFHTLVNVEGRGFPWKSVRQTKAPSRVALVTWTVYLGKILTLNNLRKRQVIVINRCCTFKRDRESVDHLLIHSDVASALWSAIFSRFGLAWVMPGRVPDLWASWWSKEGQGVPWCGKWCPHVCFGLYGEREIIML